MRTPSCLCPGRCLCPEYSSRPLGSSSVSGHCTGVTSSLGGASGWRRGQALIPRLCDRRFLFPDTCLLTPAALHASPEAQALLACGGAPWMCGGVSPGSPPGGDAPPPWRSACTAGGKAQEQLPPVLLRAASLRSVCGTTALLTSVLSRMSGQRSCFIHHCVPSA